MEPALRALWRALPNVRVALELFSTFCSVFLEYGKDSEDEDSRYYYLLVDEVSEKEWERFHLYAGYVRIIREEPPHCLVQPSVFFYLSRFCGDQPLFPHLQELTWRAMTLHHTELVLLVTPTLRKLVVELGYQHDSDVLEVEHAALNLLLHMTTPRLPGLQELVIASTSTRHVRPQAKICAWMSLAQLSHLRVLYLDCEITNTGFVAALARLPDLAELTIALSLPPEPPTSGEGGFAALRKLTLSRFSGSTDVFFALFAAPNLDTLSVALRVPPWSTALALLRTSASQYSKLRSLSFSIAHPLEHSASTAPDFHTLFSPLLRTKSIEEFSFKMSTPLFSSADETQELKRLAKAWPLLRTLTFLFDPSVGVSAEVLVAFAQHCPNLRTLRFRAIDFGSLTDEQSNATPVFSHRLNQLDACAVRFSRAGVTAAALLHRLFPHLDPYAKVDCEICDFDGPWHEDLQHVKYLAHRESVRKQRATVPQPSS
ncbi:hypothetical protein BV20DRAFT_973786 [Pilatotrama ljubarskyi]|nr:hypothetical protein BV20DRAFT_973786 [Pilatotrama ljubarskyi]